MRCSVLFTIVWNTTSPRHQYGRVEVALRILQLLCNHRRGPDKFDFNNAGVLRKTAAGSSCPGYSSLHTERFCGRCFTSRRTGLCNLQKVVDLRDQLEHCT